MPTGDAQGSSVGARRLAFARGRSLSVTVAELQGDTFMSGTFFGGEESEEKEAQALSSKRRIVGDTHRPSNFWRSLRNFLSQLQRVKVQGALDGLVHI